MACGTPVITSPSGSLPEVAGDAALMVDPVDVGDIANGLWRVATDRVLRNELVAKGHARAQEFSWRRAALQTMAVYESVVA
jgi:glycosyltransferase involved in cell wall biosynthesis